MLQDAGNAWLAWMTGMGWQVAVLILAAWVLTRLLWRSSATLRYSLWLVVFLKLLLPPSFAAPWSAGTVLEHFVAPHILLIILTSEKVMGNKCKKKILDMQDCFIYTIYKDA